MKAENCLCITSGSYAGKNDYESLQHPMKTNSTTNHSSTTVGNSTHDAMFFHATPIRRSDWTPQMQLAFRLAG